MSAHLSSERLLSHKDGETGGTQPVRLPLTRKRHRS